MSLAQLSPSLLCNIQCYVLFVLVFFLSGKSTVADTLSGIFHYSFFNPSLREGLKKKVKFSTKILTPEKKKKLSLLTLARWLLWRAFKFEPPFGPGSEMKRVNPTQKLKKKISVS